MKRVLLGIIALALAFLLLLNVRLHQPGDSGTVQAQLRHLEGALEYGAADEMQRMFPEGYVFTWALYGLASARLAGQLDEQDERRAHLLAEARRTLAAIHSDAGRAVFVRKMDPPYGVFHASWALYVRAEYVRAAGRTKLPRAEIEEFTRECDRFAQAVARYGSPFLESYPEQVWPADGAGDRRAGHSRCRGRAPLWTGDPAVGGRGSRAAASRAARAQPYRGARHRASDRHCAW